MHRNRVSGKLQPGWFMRSNRRRFGLEVLHNFSALVVVVEGVTFGASDDLAFHRRWRRSRGGVGRARSEDSNCRSHVNRGFAGLMRVASEAVRDALAPIIAWLGALFHLDVTLNAVRAEMAARMRENRLHELEARCCDVADLLRFGRIRRLLELVVGILARELDPRVVPARMTVRDRASCHRK